MRMSYLLVQVQQDLPTRTSPQKYNLPTSHNSPFPKSKTRSTCSSSPSSILTRRPYSPSSSKSEPVSVSTGVVTRNTESPSTPTPNCSLSNSSATSPSRLTATSEPTRRALQNEATIGSSIITREVFKISPNEPDRLPSPTWSDCYPIHSHASDPIQTVIPEC